MVKGNHIDSGKAVIRCAPNNYNNYNVHINDYSIYEYIANSSVKSILLNVENVEFNIPLDLDYAINKFYCHNFSLIRKKGEQRFCFYFDFYVDANDWNNTWSIGENINEFSNCISEFELKIRHFNYLEDYENLSGKIQYTICTDYIEDIESSLDYFLDKYTTAFNSAYKRILNKYPSSLNTYSLTERFNFPPEVKTACEQYLLYFAEFLKDVGIEVTASITEEDENVILAVEPKNKEEALENISQLLNLYIQLHTSPIVNSYQPASELSFPAQKLQAQVINLQSLNATIHQKDTLISQQSQTIQSQQITAQV